ncbi:2-hydroxyacyl-CoA dehydratase subunit D [Desulfotomaculum copahuensis]|uniref:2-hydroxyacyl-CoA dehydratase subunit D n=1 Tax=Desulfotomaculum copahuensis TaxID=1838280 RepID=UPI000A908449|nr:2-hydroxyacyl-CoA dehydratase family protein [Desulfotomaculum copahuensis]
MAKERRYLPLRSTRYLGRTMQRYYLLTRYQRLWGRPLKRPLAWVTSGAPVEILRALRIDPVYPENYGAICGARRVAPELCRAAEAAGYSPDLCSYARAGIGAILRPDLAPMGGLPRPDLLVTCNNICGTVLKWYEALARRFNVPLFILDTPFVTGELKQHTVDYVLEQLRGLVGGLERLTGRRLKPADLQKCISLSNEAVRLWGEIRNLCRHRPSPLNTPDLFVHMAPIVVLRGTAGAVAYYRRLYDEVKERVRAGQAAVAGERYRLLWDNIAIWYQLFRFYHLFSERGACFVTDTYTGGWAAGLAPGDPLESLARTYTAIFLNRSVDFRVRQMVDLIRDYEVDGFVMHSNRSCKPYSLVQEEIRRRVMNETGVPGLLVEADMTDARVYAEEPVRNRVQAFLETLEMTV